MQSYFRSSSSDNTIIIGNMNIATTWNYEKCIYIYVHETEIISI